MVRLIANAAIAVGIYLFVRIIFSALTGSLAARLFPESPESMENTAIALVLGLPVPFHVISIGLILQRRWLPHPWARISIPAVVISGCWLGVALGIKLVVFR